MDKQRAKIIIKKINSLFDSITMESSDLSTIERDLMLKYIRDLYELFVDSPADPASNKKNPSPPEPTFSNETKTIIKEEPMEQPKFDLHKKPEPREEKKLEEPTPESMDTSPPPSNLSPQTSASGTLAKIEALFTFQQARELSEKLSEQPIKDLPSALSINDKLLYTNELFGCQHNVLNDSLSTLNRFENMEQAKGFLVSLAEQYNWADSEREEIARSFIKTIRRRYIG